MDDYDYGFHVCFYFILSFIFKNLKNRMRIQFYEGFLRPPPLEGVGPEKFIHDFWGTYL